MFFWVYHHTENGTTEEPPPMAWWEEKEGDTGRTNVETEEEVTGNYGKCRQTDREKGYETEWQ